MLTKCSINDVYFNYMAHAIKISMSFYRYRFLVNNSHRLRVELHHKLFFYYSWLKQSITDTSFTGGMVLHILLRSVFDSFTSFSQACAITDVCGFVFKSSMSHSTLSRGPMARKKWSKKQVAYRLYNSLARFTIRRGPIRTGLGLFLWFLICDFSQKWYLWRDYIILLGALWGFLAQHRQVLPCNIVAAQLLLSHTLSHSVNMESNMLQLHRSTLYFIMSDFKFFFVI